MKQDAVRAPASLEAFDQHPGLRVDHDYRIVEQVRGVDEPSVGRDSDVADEVLHSALGRRHDRKGALIGQRAVRILELDDFGARPAAHIHEVALRRKREPQPAIVNRRAANFFLRRDVHNADRRRIVSTVERQQELAIGRERGRHRQRAYRHLVAGRLEAPAAIEQEAARVQRSHLLARRGFRHQQRR